MDELSMKCGGTGSQMHNLDSSLQIDEKKEADIPGDAVSLVL